MHADDHQIYETEKEINTVLSAVQHSATIATNWYDSNHLQGNLKKDEHSKSVHENWKNMYNG